MSTSTNHPGAVACLQRPGNSQQFATHYQLLQPTTMQQVPQAPIVQAAPMQHVNQVAPQQVYAPQYQPLQCHGQAHQYHGGNQNRGCMYQPDFNYKPNDHIALTVTMAVICGIFSIGSLFCSIPAVILSVKSKKATAGGKIKEGRRLGVCAVYLVVGAILFALIAAIILTGVMIPVLRSCPYYGGYYCSYSYQYGNRYGR